VKCVDVWSVDAGVSLMQTLALGCGGASVEWAGNIGIVQHGWVVMLSAGSFLKQ